LKRVLVVTPHYLPGYRAGGPIRSVSNMVANLSDEFEFYILTSDRDFQSRSPFPNVQYGQWQMVGNAKVRYLAPHEWRLGRLREVMQEVEFDLVHLQSFFHPKATLGPLWLRWRKQIPEVPVLVAPRGEFSPGALRIRNWKKRPFLTLVRRIGFFRGLHWVGSSPAEKEDILRVLKGTVTDSEIGVAGEFPSRLPTPTAVRPPKRPGELEVVFVSRVSRKKNLDLALRILTRIQGEVRFRIVGPAEDEAYLSECLEIVKRLPDDVTATFEGPVPADEVGDVFGAGHLFLFPTAGENFGHVLLESFGFGCPILTSDQTPWRDLAERMAGWDLPLDSEDGFVEVVQNMMGWDEDQFQRWSEGARAVYESYLTDPKLGTALRQVLRDAMNAKR